MVSLHLLLVYIVFSNQCLSFCRKEHNTGVLLIGGHSGVGKTALIKHVFDLVYRKKEVLIFFLFTIQSLTCLTAFHKQSFAVNRKT